MAEYIHCRYCDNDKSRRFLDLGQQALANSFLKSNSKDVVDQEEKFPLDVYFCENCGLVHIGTIIDPEKLFSDYIYFSSTSDAIHRHGKYLAQSFKKKFGLNESSLVVEIASNDGCVLNYFKQEGMKVLGVEPAKNIAEVAIKSGIPTETVFFSEKSANKLENEYGKADIILGRNVFAHIPFIHDFVKGLSHMIKSDGVIAIEAPHLLELITNIQFDTVYHEHVSYLSLRAMENLFKQYNMKVFDVEFSALNGGSLIYFITPDANKKYSISENVKNYRKKEEEAGLYNLDTYLNFSSKVNKLRDDLLTMLKDLKSQNKKIVGYGASAKGNVLLMFCGLDSTTLDYIVDKSEPKQNMYAPGSHIPVYHPKKLLEDKPDYTLILAWNLADEIMKQQSAYAEEGGKFIIPVPKPRIV